jgi:transposase
VIEPWLQLIDSVLKDHPTVRATALHTLLKGRGYSGSVYPIRKYCQQKRGRSDKAYLDLQFLPGEMAQVDWASFGTIRTGRDKRKLHAFVMVLSYSRRIFARFFYDMKSARVLEGHVLAFKNFGGIPRQVLYDNMKTAVIEHVGSGVRFNESLLELAAHYSFLPQACNPRSGWEKGRVERAIRYLRESFFTARKYEDLQDLNHQLETWLDEVAMERDWADDQALTVREAFSHENLNILPEESFDAYEEKAVRVDKKAMIRFDTNRYPVNPEYAGTWLTIRATQESVKILSKTETLHTYPRIWKKHETLRVPEHQEQIAKARKIRTHRASRCALERTIDCGRLLLTTWAELDENIQLASRQVLELIPQYGLETVEAACQLALENGTPRACSIAQLLAENTQPPRAIGRLHLQHEVPEVEINWSSTESYDDLCE